jgi:hypothetical protein
MKQKTPQSLAQRATYWLGVVAIGLVSGLGLQFAQAWTNPTEAPPGGNVAGPLTTGSAYQKRGGGLGIYDASGAYSASTLNLSARDISTSADESLYLNWSNQSGNVHIGGEGEKKELVINGIARFSYTPSEGGTLSLLKDQGPNVHLENLNGKFRLINGPWNLEMFGVRQDGNLNVGGTRINMANSGTNYYGDSQNTAARQNGGFFVQSADGSRPRAMNASALIDGDNGVYYVDPDSWSKMAYISVRSMNDADNGLYYMDMNGESRFEKFAANRLYVGDIGGPSFSPGGNGNTVAQVGPAAEFVIKNYTNSGYRPVVASAFNVGSDERLKKDIVTIPAALDKVSRLRGVYFDWKNEEQDGGAHQVGVIAQEVEAVLPEAVHTNSDGYKTVDYGKLSSVLIEAVKEQQKQIDEQRKEIEALKQKISQ